MGAEGSGWSVSDRQDVSGVSKGRSAHLEQLGRSRPPLGVDLERGGKVVAEGPAERLGPLDLGRAVGCDQVELRRDKGSCVSEDWLIGVRQDVERTARSGFSFRLRRSAESATISCQSRQTSRGTHYGGSPSTISIAMMPSDQTSTLGPYSLRVTTSGAIQ